MTHKIGHNVQSQNGAVWEWNPGAKPINRITSQFPTLPVDGVQRGEQEAAAEGLTGIKTTNQDGFSMADIMKLLVLAVLVPTHLMFLLETNLITTNNRML